MNPVDLARLKELIQLMDRNQLVELEVEAEGSKVRLRKKGDTIREVAALPAMGLAPAVGVAPLGGAAPAGEAGAGPEAIPEGSLIRAPMVGTYYAAPSPEAPPFIEVGDKVEEGQLLCIIEAMKVMNEVKAERSGTIEGILVDNGASVEFGTPLFRIN
ncbi:MAG: acetyl-CoA carboxylase biotin carboxyl carrier protein [Planctomycetota bacterium]|jgi:acetyl-CoA carboxylase biotin carboxyl carrier protein